MTYRGPTSVVSSSRFISCCVTYAGGAFYHNGNDNDSIILSDSLFSCNTADTVDDSHIDNGGGALKDCKENSYSSEYTFSFFSGNIADTNCGHDITLQYKTVPIENITHCLTTTLTNSFWNVTKHESNWLPHGNISDVHY